MNDTPDLPPDEPQTTEEIAAILREAGYDPDLVYGTMERLADEIITRERNKRIDAWLDSLQDEPLSPEEVERVMDYIRAELKK